MAVHSLGVRCHDGGKTIRISPFVSYILNLSTSRDSTLTNMLL